MTVDVVYRRGHYGVALLTYAPLAGALLALGYDALALIGGAVMVGSAMLPDVDQKLPLIEHRGATHSIAFAVLVGLALGAVGTVVATAGSIMAGTGLGLFGFGVGTLSVLAHLLADVLTPAGIRPFWPVSDRTYSLQVTTAANPLANYVLLGLGIAVSAGVALVAVRLRTV